jgi:hypothetical protein
MNTPGNGLDHKLRQLLELVTRHRDEQCGAIRASAEAEAKVLLRTAWREQRERLHNDNVETRRRVEQALVSQEAQQQTRRRQQQQARDAVLLVAAREALQSALLQRWQQPASRRQWCETLVAAAIAVLDVGEWFVEHSSDWPENEQQSLLARIQSHCGKTPRMQADAGIRAGLRICAANTCVDATLNGLLHDRERIDAELLALCAGHSGEAA